MNIIWLCVYIDIDIAYCCFWFLIVQYDVYLQKILLREQHGEAFDELKKPDLMTLAQYLNVEVKHAMHKQEIKNILIDHFVDDDLLDGFCLDH